MSSLSWFRVDDRLIHGQVMVGWVIPLNIRSLILASDELATDTRHQRICRRAVESFTPQVNLRIVPLSQAPAYFKKSEPTMLITSSPGDARTLYRRGLGFSPLNLGGVHARQGRVRLLPFLYLDSAEMDAILELSVQGVRVIAQELPNSRAFDVVKLITEIRR